MRFSLLTVLLFVIGAAFGMDGTRFLEQGDAYYERRAEGARGDHADQQNILTALALYRYALADSSTEEAAAGKILRAYYFQGCYAYIDAQDRMRTHTEAIEFGARYYSRFPTNPGIGYWYAVNLSLWAKERGPLQAVKEGAAERIRKIAETMIAMTDSPPVDQAGAYQILGRMHQLLPRVPLILTWPDKRLAEAYLRKSIEVDPDELTGYLFLGELLRDQGRHLEAAQLIYSVLKRPPRNDEYMEDNRNLWKLRQLSKSLRISEQERLQVIARYP